MNHKKEFKIRFNTLHGESDLYWRVIIDDTEYLVRSVKCYVNTYTDASFDTNAGTIKYHIAGAFTVMNIDLNLNAVFK